MKKQYFKHVEIDKKIMGEFIQNHPILSGFVSADVPFYVRVSKKTYPGLIHTIISQDQDSTSIINQWNALINLAGKIKPKYVNVVSWESLKEIVGEEKANLIKKITLDIIENRLDLDKLQKSDELTIVNTLSQYGTLSLNSIRTYLIFTCFKQNVLCDSDPDFIKGLKIFLNKENIEKEDINNITIEYKGQLTLFSLCMWKIRNERVGK